MNSTTYKLSLGLSTWTLRDYADSAYRRMLDARAQSGDYLINLVAELGHIAIEVKKANPGAYKSLINLAKDLSYIDDKYIIAKKSKKPGTNI